MSKGKGQLTLTRAVGESIVIGAYGGVRITVARISRGKVRIMVEADKEVPVWREELLEHTRHLPRPPGLLTGQEREESESDNDAETN